MTDSEIVDGITFVVDGKPVPKARPRTVRQHGQVRTFTPKSTTDYEELVRACWRKQTGGQVLTCRAVGAYLDFYMPIPESLSRKKQAELDGQPHVKRGDIDNLIKSVVDGVNGYIFSDDSQICFIQATKTYSFAPRVEAYFFNCDEMEGVKNLFMNGGNTSENKETAES